MKFMKRIATYATSLLALASTAFAEFPYQLSQGSFPDVYAADYTDFNWNWSDAADQKIEATFANSGYSNVAFKLVYPAYGNSYLEAYNGTATNLTNSTAYSLVLAASNIPPPNQYFGEFLGFNDTNGLKRILARGKVTTKWSVWSVTNTASWSPRVITVNYVPELETDPIAYPLASNAWWKADDADQTAADAAGAVASTGTYLSALMIGATQALGSAAFTSYGDYATDAQGALADGALQVDGSRTASVLRVNTGAGAMGSGTILEMVPTTAGSPYMGMTFGTVEGEDAVSWQLTGGSYNGGTMKFAAKSGFSELSVDGTNVALVSATWPWSSITGSPDVGLSSPRDGWRVWGDGSRYFAVHGSGAGAVTNASFSWVMNHIMTNAANWLTVVNLANEASPNTPLYFYVDAPIRIKSGVTFRGHGNYGSTVKVATNYTGALWLCGDGAVVGGIIAFDRIRFQDDLHANTNAVLDFSWCSEAKVYDCEFTGNVGQAIKMDVSGTTAYAHWNDISRTWFVGTHNAKPMVDIVATNGNSVRDFALSACHFWTTTGAMVRAVGDVSGLQVIGGSFKYAGTAAGTATGIVASGGSGHVLCNNAFYAWPINSTPISFDPAASNQFVAAVNGNVFSANCTSTNGIAIGTHAHSVRAVDNPGMVVVSYGINAGGFAGVGTIAASNSGSYVKSSGGNATNMTASGTFSGNGAGLTNIALFNGAVNSTTTTLASNAVLYAYGTPNVGTNRTIAGAWLQLAVTTNAAAAGGFTDVTNLALEVYGSYSVGGVNYGSTAVMPVPLGGTWQSTSFSGYWTYTVEIPTNLAITTATSSGLMPTYPRYGLRYRGPVAATSVTFCVSAKWLP